MNATLEPMLALLGLGGTELVVIFLCLLVFVTMVGGGIIIAFALLARGKRSEKIPPAQPSQPAPPVATSTVVMRKCPKCGADLKADAPEGLCPACLLQHGLASESGAPPGTPPFTPPPISELAKLFPQLEILEPIGQGGMGAVYKARQPALDRFVALKILAPRSGGDVDFEGRFGREARALAKLNHPNIVAVHDFGTVGQPGGTGALNYFIMEYVDGPNLRQVERAGKLAPREALQIIPQICAALQFAHDEGIVHRDIKPENVLLDKKGRVKIADFGLAKILGQQADFRLTGARDVMGTPHYMAPEQVEKPQEVDHRADIYSLGVVFYEMLTGELPIGKFDPPSHKVQIDVRLDDVVLRSLANNPDRRYQQVSQVKTEVETIAHTPSPAGAQAAAETFAREAAVRDYQLNIGHCISRGWNLVKNHFWPTVAANALVTILLFFTGTFSFTVSPHSPGAHIGSGLSFFLVGPLMGGLYLFYLKLMRGERPNLEIVFSGFSHRLVQLFLGNLVATLLVTLGLICLILPGIYLSTAWLFTLVLIIDKGIDFWPAMELSRKVITRHWWKFFGFAVVLLLLKSLGVLFCIIGVFITGPIVHAALLYAYEDILGSQGRTSALAGPSAPTPQDSSSKILSLAIGAGAVLVFIALLGFAAAIFVPNFLKARHRALQVREEIAAAKAAAVPKTIVLVRPAMQIVDESNDVRTVTLWSDSYLEPGETITAFVKHGNAVMGKAQSMKFLNWQTKGTRVSSSLTWFFGGVINKGFGEADAEAAMAQLNDFTNRPVELKPGTPLPLFSVTNQNGEVMSGFVQFERTVSVAASGGNVAAIVHLRRFTAFMPSIDYSATVPAGYALRATASSGSANTFTPAGPSEYHSSWSIPPLQFPPRRSYAQGVQVMPAPPKIESPQEMMARNKAVEEQLQALQDQGPISVQFGAPKLIFSETNSSGEVFQGFLELVGPGKPPERNSSLASEEPPVAAPSPTLPLPLSGVIQPTRMLRTNPFTGQGASPEQQTVLTEIERMKSELDKSGQNPKAKTSLTDEVAAKIDPATGLPVTGQMPPGGNIARIDPTTGLPAANAPESETILFAEQPSVVVETFPTSGARDVAPGDTEIRVRFSKPMEDGSWSWSSAFENSTPESVDAPHYLEDGCTCVMKVRLSPGRTYAWWLNSDKFHNFKDRAGRPAVPYLLIFQTKPNGN